MLNVPCLPHASELFVTYAIESSACAVIEQASRVIVVSVFLKEKAIF